MTVDNTLPDWARPKLPSAVGSPPPEPEPGENAKGWTTLRISKADRYRLAMMALKQGTKMTSILHRLIVTEEARRG